jgi:ATP-dependent Clp protease protease subunit
MATAYDNRLIRNDDDDDAEAKDAGRHPDYVGKALFDSRTILITGGISDKTAQRVCAQMFALAAVSDDPILLVVSSPGGHVESGDMIHDTMKFIKPRVDRAGLGLGRQRRRADLRGRGKGRPLLPAEHALLAAPTLRRRRRHGL